jgi:preprotein translocase subunit SecF
MKKYIILLLMIFVIASLFTGTSAQNQIQFNGGTSEMNGNLVQEQNQVKACLDEVSCDKTQDQKRDQKQDQFQEQLKGGSCKAS